MSMAGRVGFEPTEELHLGTFQEYCNKPDSAIYPNHAERTGFEPVEGFGPRFFSKELPSSAQPPFLFDPRNFQCVPQP